VLRLPPPLLMLAAGVVQRVVSPSATPSRGRTTVAVALAVASASFAGASATRFRRSGTTVQPFEPEQASTLVTTGANALTRNPMYVGMTGLLLAHAAYRGSWRALVPAATFVTFIDRYQVLFEEQALAAKFGAAYDEYRATVPRWLDARSFAAAQSG
jgi:protein-S-isoprenylcysteine O-methyltransferase Ste14